MKHVDMKSREEKPVAVRSTEERKVEGAFDVWLNRGLHRLFDEVANEPIPVALLKLIDDDRSK